MKIDLFVELALKRFKGFQQILPETCTNGSIRHELFYKRGIVKNFAKFTPNILRPVTF